MCLPEDVISEHNCTTTFETRFNCTSSQPVDRAFLAIQCQRDADSTPQDITFKHFEAGNTFMAADSFHARVEKQFRKKKNIFDFNDYVLV